MTGLVFVDSNVLVYVRDARDAAKQSCANAWVARLWRERQGRTSVQVLSEFYATVTRRLKPRVPDKDAWDDVKSFLAWHPQPIDVAVLQRAREVEQRHRLSWWDSMIVAAAQLQDCALLLSEDMHDGAVFGGVTVRSPFTLTVEAPRPAYAVASSTRPHRPRGRPRKTAALSL